ncbi:MAG: hypothetical protein ABIQ39_07420 [Ilumatobacteraceae bacterium]
MGSGLLGFVLGLVVPVAFSELGMARKRRHDAASRRFADAQPNWDATMPAPRTALRPRWESNSDPADEDDLGEFIVTVVLALLITAAILFTASSVARFALFFLSGATLGGTSVIGYGWLKHRVLPPGARHVVVRSGIVGVIASFALLWFTRTTFHSLSYPRVRSALLNVSLRHRPAQVQTSFGTDGTMLYLSLAVGLMLVVGLLVSLIIDAAATLAAARLGEGSLRPIDRWLAQFYPRRQLRVWITSVLVSVVAFMLCAGVLLPVYDHFKLKPVIKPGLAPTVLHGNGAGSSTGPSTTLHLPTATTVP